MRAIVFPPEPITSYAKQIHSHLKRVDRQPDLRAGFVEPIHRHLGDSVASATSHEQHLHVKAVPVHSHPRKKILSDRRTEKLEPTLGILHACVRQPFDKPME